MLVTLTRDKYSQNPEATERVFLLFVAAGT